MVDKNVLADNSISLDVLYEDSELIQSLYKDMDNKEFSYKGRDIQLFNGKRSNIISKDVLSFNDLKLNTICGNFLNLLSEEVKLTRGASEVAALYNRYKDHLCEFDSWSVETSKIDEGMHRANAMYKTIKYVMVNDIFNIAEISVFFRNYYKAGRYGLINNTDKTILAFENALLHTIDYCNDIIDIWRGFELALVDVLFHRTIGRVNRRTYQGRIDLYAVDKLGKTFLYLLTPLPFNIKNNELLEYAANSIYNDPRALNAIHFLSELDMHVDELVYIYVPYTRNTPIRMQGINIVEMMPFIRDYNKFQDNNMLLSQTECITCPFANGKCQKADYIMRNKSWF